MKSMNKIGGWLAVFRILNCLAAFAIAMYTVSIIGIFILKKDAHLNGFFLADVCFLVAAFAVEVKIILLMHQKIPQSPTSISKLIIAFAVLQFCSYGVSLTFSLASMPPGTMPQDLMPPSVIRAIAWAFIWVLYFQKSERVKQFYGANAFETISHISSPVTAKTDDSSQAGNAT